MYHDHNNLNEARVAILIASKVNFRRINTTREEYFVMIKNT